MKTAISIPNTVFQSAERLARKLKVSRSELYVMAIRFFMDTKKQENLTSRLDHLYENEPARLDPQVQDMQFRSLPKEPW